MATKGNLLYRLRHGFRVNRQRSAATPSHPQLPVERAEVEQDGGATVYAALDRQGHHRSVEDWEKKEEGPSSRPGRACSGKTAARPVRRVPGVYRRALPETVVAEASESPKVSRSISALAIVTPMMRSGAQKRNSATRFLTSSWDFTSR